MKHSSILILFFLLSFYIEAQSLDVYADANLGVPTAFTLRTFHDELAEQTPYDNFETTDNFNYNYGFTIGTRFNKKIAIFYTNRVSGAKSSYSDYSGFVRLTNELKGSTIGGKYELLLKETTKGNLILGFKVLATSSVLLLKTESQILTFPQNDGVDFKSWDFGGGVGIAYEYPIKFLILRAFADVDIYYGGKFKLKNDSGPEGGFLLTSSGNKVTSGWTGLNAGIGIAFTLGK